MLATWRIASLLTSERGPGWMFQHLRELAGITHDDDGEKAIVPESFLAETLACVWCSSIWVGVFWVAFDWIWPLGSIRFALVFALSAGAILVNLITSR